jgi:cell division protein FtsB
MADQPDVPPESVPAPARRPRIRKRSRTPQEAKQWRRRLAGYALVAAAFILVVNALVGENGYLATMQARRQYEDLTRQLQKITDENRQMKDQIKRLHSDPTELEDAARKDLHMSKPGEKMVIIKDETKPKAPQEPGK